MNARLAVIRLALAVSLALPLPSCGSAAHCHLFRAQEYGCPTADTLTVTVLGRFKKTGIYHVPIGTTVGDMIRMAEMLPAPPGKDDGWILTLTQSKNGFRARDGISRKGLDIKLADHAKLKVLRYTF